jgi:ferredoxin-type protein NapG
MAGDDITRRDLLRGLRKRRDAPPPARPIVHEGRALPSVIAWLDPDMRPTERRQSCTPALLRPPGAVAEAEFLALCTRCGDCAAACPHEAIVSAPPQLREAEGTPLIAPREAPCRMCEDLPCIRACKPRALRPEAPAALGTASVSVLDCLNRLGSTCSVCIEQCPVPGAMELEGGVPRVRAPLCTGCGLCQHVCPAPQNAILLLPNPDRPTAASLDQRAAALPAATAGGPELPQLHEAVLDAAGLRALFSDLALLAHVEEIRLKSAATALARERAPTLEAALDDLLAGRVRGVQIRYRHQDRSWCDTILAAAGGHRVVRLAV